MPLYTTCPDVYIIVHEPIATPVRVALELTFDAIRERIAKNAPDYGSGPAMAKGIAITNLYEAGY